MGPCGGGARLNVPRDEASIGQLLLPRKRAPQKKSHLSVQGYLVLPAFITEAWKCNRRWVCPCFVQCLAKGPCPIGSGWGAGGWVCTWFVLSLVYGS